MVGYISKKVFEKSKKGRFGPKNHRKWPVTRTLLSKSGISVIEFIKRLTDGLDHPPISVEVTIRGYSAQSPIIRELYVPIHLCKGSISSDFLRVFN